MKRLHLIERQNKGPSRLTCKRGYYLERSSDIALQC